MHPETTGVMPKQRSSRLVQPELAMLAVAFACTAAAKFRVLWMLRNSFTAAAMVEVLAPDAVFLLLTATALTAIRAAWPGPRAARASSVAGASVLAWSIANASWLLTSGTILHPGILAVIASEPVHFWPAIRGHVGNKPLIATAGALALVAASALLARAIARPSPCDRRRLARSTAALGTAAIVAWGAGPLASPLPANEAAIDAIAFSSHAYALRWLIGAGGTHGDVMRSARTLAKRGERPAMPPAIGTARSNVVVLFLESVSLEATSLGSAGTASTPALERLASEGIEFTRAYAPVPQTNKALFATLTGCTPDIAPDYAETIIADQPYESLATMLAKDGYRTAFFQVAPGTFGCVPVLLANLGFDAVSCLEDHHAEDIRLSYFSADDGQLLQPMLDWIDRAPSPFLLCAITSMSHAPFHVPARCASDAPATEHERYLRAVTCADGLLSDLVDALRTRNLLDKTLVCVIGDHGEGFRDGVNVGRITPREDVIHVPWVMRLPGAVPIGAKIDEVVSQEDVTPTVLRSIGWDIDNAGFDGANVSNGMPAGRRKYFDAWFSGEAAGFVEGNRKVVWWPSSDRVLEFDLRADPMEAAPRRLGETERDSSIRDIEAWKAGVRLDVDPRRFRESLLYGRWQTASSGRHSWTKFMSQESVDP